MDVIENAAYLKGLAEGLKVDESTNEGKLILKMLDVIGEMAKKISALEVMNDDLYDYMEEMARDIVALEDDIYSDDEDYEDYSDLNDDDFDCDPDEEYYELECPSCGEKICFTEDFDIDGMVCPACGEAIGDIELCDGDCSDCNDCE